MSDKATFSWADSLNLDLQWTQDKREVRRMCGNFKPTARSVEGAQKWV
jgi:hypothetical protein